MATVMLERKQTTQRDYAAIGLSWLAANYERVEGLAMKSCRGRYDLVEDLLGEAVDRVAGIAANFEPALGTQNQHYMSNLRWYFFKWMNKNAARLARVETLYDVHSSSHVMPDLDDRNAVQEIMSGLDEYNRTLLFLYYVHDMTFEEIGNRMGVSKGTARLHVLHALDLARENADGCTSKFEDWRSSREG